MLSILINTAVYFNAGYNELLILLTELIDESRQWYLRNNGS